ncbi:murein L,D-transpeptidase catalytic domain family protein [Sphingobacterium lumbrici]|uniref:murein L,D-transpeptidase catalytic domain family protein n=1 Tax=Sphingobacterium lumbrici TaxID=2559600 RepID=UPI001127638B|nr:murein L,D-transpeptidase catalytic domain family protein [Sphingobacterium lumbrici]
MKNLLFILITTWFFSNFVNQNNSLKIVNTPSLTDTRTANVDDSTEIEKLYSTIKLEGTLKFDAFEQAMIGYEKLPIKNKNIITVIDFTLPSTDKRMYVIDLKNKKLLYHSIVSHGRNSGENYAKAFSNKHGSYQSSLGFFVTENTYQGGNGYSLVINGLERGINDQAKPRAVVIHGADYCSNAVIASTGRLGRSYGCPALPREVTKPIINTIKEGTMLFIYADNKDYIAQSKVLKSVERGLLAQHEIEKATNSNISLN